MRRFRALAALVLGVSLLALPAFGSTAVADPTYPPAVCATLSVSTTTPFAGQSITVSGLNFDAGARVRLELRSDPVTLATVTVGADGSFTTSVTIPESFSGNHVIAAVGGQTSTCPADPITVRITGGVAGATAGPDGSGGGLSSTGVKVGAFVLVALALLAAGAFLTRAGRSRTTHASRHRA